MLFNILFNIYSHIIDYIYRHLKKKNIVQYLKALLCVYNILFIIKIFCLYRNLGQHLVVIGFNLQFIFNEYNDWIGNA